MAFSSFGTGMATVAKGMTFQPDWNAETNRIMALTQQTQNFYEKKMQIADKVYEATKHSIIPNEADSRDYNAWLDKEVFPDIHNYTTSNPDYMINPEKYKIWKQKTERIRDNIYTRRGEDFKAQKEAANKFITENAEIDPRERDLILEKMNVRATQGIDAYRAKYPGEQDFTFAPPRIVKWNDMLTEALAANRVELTMQEIGIIDGHKFVGTIEKYQSIENVAKAIIASNPARVKSERIQNQQFLTPAEKTESDEKWLIQQLINRKLPEKTSDIKDINIGDDKRAQQQVDIASYNAQTSRRSQQSDQARNDAYIENLKKQAADNYELIMQQRGLISGPLVTQLIPSSGPKTFDANKNNPGYVENRFAGERLILNKQPIATNTLLQNGFSVFYNAGSSSKIIREVSGDSSVITFTGRVISESFSSKGDLINKIETLDSKNHTFDFLKQYIKESTNGTTTTYKVEMPGQEITTKVLDEEAKVNFNLQYDKGKYKPQDPNGTPAGKGPVPPPEQKILSGEDDFTNQSWWKGTEPIGEGSWELDVQGIPHVLRKWKDSQGNYHITGKPK